MGTKTMVLSLAFILAFIGSAVALLIGILIFSEVQGSMLSTFPAPILISNGTSGGVLSTDLYTCDKKVDSGNNEIHKISEFDGTVISSVTFTGIVGTSTFFNSITGCFALATDPTDLQMYAIMEDFTSTRFITKIDPTTGVGIAIAPLTRTIPPFPIAFFGANAMAFNSTGQMFVLQSAGNSRTPYEVDKTTGILNIIDVDEFFGGLCKYTTLTKNNPFALNYDDGFMYHISGDTTSSTHIIGQIDFTDSDCIGSSFVMNTIDDPIGGSLEAPSVPFDMTYSTTQGKFLHRSHDDVNSNATPQTLLTVETDGTTVLLCSSFLDDCPNISQRGLAFALTGGGGGSSPPVFESQVPDSFNQASNIAFTVIAILPIALFFVLFAIFGGRTGE